MKSYFEGQKKELLEFINDETKFKEKCFPGVFELEKCIQEFEEGIKKRKSAVKGWKNGSKLAKLLKTAKIL